MILSFVLNFANIYVKVIIIKPLNIFFFHVLTCDILF